MTIITRFAPSPTGFLHIGSVRTALFNYLFAKKNKGKFLLRIEDTDKERSTDEATDAIFEAMSWLNLDYDEKVIYQSSNKIRHQEVALSLVRKGKAYLCFSSQEEVNNSRNQLLSKKEHFIFNSPWRDAKATSYPKGIKPVIRLKAPKEGVTIVRDLLQGNIIVQNSQLDDMILLRSNGSPTYMLAVVVDDNDMGITHIIRGDDHLSNAHRQQILYKALNYSIPAMVHIPLIHESNGIKLSKRRGALGTQSYKEMGYLPEAMCNYLLRLGWAYGNREIISRKEAIELFNIEGLGKSPAKLDLKKIKFLNAYYLRLKTDIELTNIISNMIEKNHCISDLSKSNILKAMPSLKIRADSLLYLREMAMMYIVDFPIIITDKAKQVILEMDDTLLRDVSTSLISIKELNRNSIQEKLKEVAKKNGLKVGELMHFVRAFMAGDLNSPSIFEMIEILGLKNSICRLKKLV